MKRKVKLNKYGYDVSKLIKFDLPVKYNEKTGKLDIIKTNKGDKMKRFLTIKDGCEEGVNLMIPFEESMGGELLGVISDMEKEELPIEISYGEMSDEEYRENNIKSLMYGDDCTREEAIEIVDKV